MRDEGNARSNCVIEVQSEVTEATRDKSHDGDEPGESAGDALRHAQSFVESVQGTEGS